MHDVRAQPDPLGDARAEALDEDVGGVAQLQHQLDAFGRLGVDADRPAAAGQRVDRQAEHVLPRRRAIDADHVGAEVGEDHRGERPGREPGQFDHLQAAERTCLHGVVPFGAAQSEREMISFMISLVPPKIREIRTSAQARAIGYSDM